MKYQLKKSLIEPKEVLNPWHVKELNLEGTELIEALSCHLTNVMAGILDPDIAGKKPDGFLSALQSGRFGDFSKRYIITACDKDKVVGLLIGLPEENQKLHIYLMGVLSAYRKLGVGHALLGKCFHDMLLRDINELILDVHSENIPAQSLYRKFGFI